MAPRQRNTANSLTSAAQHGNSVQQSSHHTSAAAIPGSMHSNASGSHSSTRNSRTQGKHYSQFDFNSLNIHILRKYRQVFKLNVKARSSKDDLVVAAARHFSNHMVDEVDTIARFLYTVHSNKEGKSSVGII